MKIAISNNSIDPLFQATVNDFITRLSKKPEVLGIVLLGGLGMKQHFDKFSDVDISVFVIKPLNKIPNWLPGFEFEFEILNSRNKYLSFNIHQQDFILEKSSTWNAVKVEAYMNGIVAFDKQNKITNLIKHKIKQFKKQASKRLIEIFAMLPASIEFHPLKQCHRGLISNAHFILNNAISDIVELIYLVNGSIFPHPKWRIENSFKLQILPKFYKKKLNQALIIRELSARDIYRRIKLLKSIYMDLKLEISEKLNLNSDPYTYACKKILNRQLINQPYCEKVMKIIKFRGIKISSKDSKYLFGLINFYLISNSSELVSLLNSNQNIRSRMSKEMYNIIMNAFNDAK
ncbi:MAG: hypothetical protein IPK91_06270 [Saprospiraceae bacterium]|nr:hypothetical protein [Saprospiraceae bacterium]